jgi:cyclic pyranopterin phosphate synthase
MKVDSLRLSVTQRCNLNCVYCHREGEGTSRREMPLTEIENIVRAAKEIGILKIKLTGGEPLIRKDIVEIIKTIKKYEFEDISLVTNGFLLADLAGDLKRAGLNRVNIGCDSLSSNILLKNRRNIEPGLKKAKEVGFNPIKLNMVVLKGINDNEIEDMINFSKKNKVILQLIELINNGDNNFYKKYFFSLHDIEKRLEERSLSIMEKGIHNRRQYNLGEVYVEVVRPFTHGFCENCKRIRVTAEGKIKPCLIKKDEITFKDKHSLLEAIGYKTHVS